MAATILREGNFDYATNTVKWDAAAQTIPDSLYLTSKPAFFGNNTWPWVDPTGTTKLYTLPARFRFDNPARPNLGPHRQRRLGDGGQLRHHRRELHRDPVRPPPPAR